MTLNWKNRECDDRVLPRLSGIFRATKPNSPKNIDRRKRLDIQPFFYAFTACMPDFDQILGAINPYMNPDAYTAALEPIRALNRRIHDAGYTRNGVPLWVPEHRLPDDDLLRVADAAEACLPLLNTHYEHLRVQMGRIGDAAVQPLTDFTARYTAFSKAIEGLRDIVDLRAYTARKYAAAAVQTACALA